MRQSSTSPWSRSAAASEGQGDLLTDFDLVLVAATEQLLRDQRVSDTTWAAIRVGSTLAPPPANGPKPKIDSSVKIA